MNSVARTLRKAAWLLGLAMAAVGCGKDEASPDGGYEGLYASETASANTATVFGVWGNKKDAEAGKYTYESRIRLAPTSVMVATRCTRSSDGASVIVGVTAAAAITETRIKVTEPKTDSRQYGAEPQDECRAYVNPLEEGLIRTGSKLAFVGDVFDKYAD